ncbi:flavin reductase family protein [Rhodoligotrophos defluvii]|uniref:flavin reductase family protein n=1 Tax=Rhodoligotrophos defluvii TaxID=2561934 RepID=UPI0010C95F13|nr:flavin reductase family protein [Rhodoligotrophos defluvii]
MSLRVFHRADDAGAEAIPLSPDAQGLRKVLGCFTTGVVVATTLGPSEMPVGLTINSFNSVSLNPPLILWSLSLSAPSLAAFRGHPAFAINILSADQADLCHRFARPARDKFAGIPWSRGLMNVPLLSDALASLECAVWRRHEGGDHEIIIGEVRHLRATDKAPLVYHRGRLTQLPADDKSGSMSAMGGLA